MKINFVFDLQEPSKANDQLAGYGDLWPNGSYSSDSVYVTIFSVSDTDKAKESRVLPLAHDNVALYKTVFDLAEASSLEGDDQRVHVTNFNAGAAQDLRASSDLKMGKGSENTSFVVFDAKELWPDDSGPVDISFMYSDTYSYGGEIYREQHCDDIVSLNCAWDDPEIFRVGMTYWQEDDEETPCRGVHFSNEY